MAVWEGEWGKKGCERRCTGTDVVGLFDGGAAGRGQTGLPANFRQNTPEIHGSLVSPRGGGISCGRRPRRGRLRGSPARPASTAPSLPSACVFRGWCAG